MEFLLELLEGGFEFGVLVGEDGVVVFGGLELHLEFLDCLFEVLGLVVGRRVLFG